MLIELKTFQIDSVSQLIDELDWAKSEFSDRGKLQAVVLAAPTGSGKTIIATRLIESIIFGSEQSEPEMDASFLWLSDRPQLNRQSRNKMIASSELLTDDRLIEIEADFDREMFEGGKVYFLNTQKLGQEKRLTSSGDERNFTIWETIQNTARVYPTKFHLILDEAHRGLGNSKISSPEGLQPTIVQKFLKGSEGELSPIPIVLGISATPARFQLLLTSDLSRQIRNVTVDPYRVRESGLLKDRVTVFHPDRGAQTVVGSEFALLAEATREWLKISATWDRYTETENILPIEPALIVQVEDGGSGITSKTDLLKVIKTIEEVAGQLPEGSVRHCFDSEAAITINGRLVEKVDASEIQSLSYVKVVLFKTSLSTGWDCPRAEVMMSFRRVQDATLIAQLIGRMVRTPLARRITDVDELNSVALFLPHYDQAGLDAVISHLKRDAESASASDITLAEKVQTLNQSLWSEGAFSALSQVPTYRLERTQKIPPVKRALRLAFYLTQAGIHKNAFSDVQAKLLEFLHSARIALSASDHDFERKVALADKLPLVGWEFSQGEWKILERSTRVIPLTEETLELIFKKAGVRVCGSGEGLPMKYFRSRVLSGDFNNDHMRPKIEFVLIAEDAASIAKLEKIADEIFDNLYNIHRAEIRSLNDESRQDIENLRTRGQVPEPVDMKPWKSIVVPLPDLVLESTKQTHHLYVDDTHGWAPIYLSPWEQSVVNHVQTAPDFVAWLRNFPKKEWALTIPYLDAGDYKPHFPDLLVVRETPKSFLVDILEPHGLNYLKDSWVKAKGMADYAARHAYQPDTSVGSVGMQTVNEAKNSLYTLDFSRVDVQKEMRHVTSIEAFTHLFDRLCTVESLRTVRVLEEHNCVVLTKSIFDEGEEFEIGIMGVIVSVYADHFAYAVEFPSKLNGSAVIIVTSQQIKLASL